MEMHSYDMRSTCVGVRWLLPPTDQCPAEVGYPAQPADPAAADDADASFADAAAADDACVAHPCTICCPSTHL